MTEEQNDNESSLIRLGNTILVGRPDQPAIVIHLTPDDDESDGADASERWRRCL